MDVPFGARVLALLVIATTLSAVDFHRHGKQSTAYQEYGLIFAAGILGALLGGAADAVTSRISPEYFIFGKGLTDGDGLRFEAIQYGLKVRFSGGIICGAILVYVGRRKSKTAAAGFSFLLKRLWIPITAAIAGGAILPVVASASDPMGLRKQLENIVPQDKIPAFLQVWWTHAGVYSGLLVGMIALVAAIVRRRSAGRL